MYYCKKCWCNFTDTPEKWYNKAWKRLWLTMYLEWVWIRSISRILSQAYWKITNVAVWKWFEKIWDKLEDYHKKTMLETKIIEWELDEIQHYVKKTKQSSNMDYCWKMDSKNYWFWIRW